MLTFQELYRRTLRKAAQGESEPHPEKMRGLSYDPRQLDCLLHPKQYAPVWRFEDCGCSEGEKDVCIGRCLFNALGKDEDGNVVVREDACVGCHVCIENCKAKKLIDRKDVLPVLAALNEGNAPVYALIAPAFIGQFQNDVTPGKLRSALKRIGFAGMVEVALFADILTLREALEFDRTIRRDRDFILTSCCCPVWIAMIRKVYSNFVSHIPGAVSPMVACGRAVKHLEPGAVTVFIGPCLAKKAESREPDVADAVDYVLTFEEVQDIFDAFEIDPAAMEDDQRDHSSKSGRIYARAGGVSEAVKQMVERISPARPIPLKAQRADGIPALKEMLNALGQDEITGNYLEGMACVGGCVGGPKAVLNREEGKENVNRYGDQAAHETPIDNPFVMDLLERLGIPSVEQLLEEDSMFGRKF